MKGEEKARILNANYVNQCNKKLCKSIKKLPLIVLVNLKLTQLSNATNLKQWINTIIFWEIPTKNELVIGNSWKVNFAEMILFFRKRINLS